MLLDIIKIIVPVLAIIVLFFAYFKNSTLGKLSAFTMLAAILLAHLLNGLAGLISGVDFLNFLESILKGISGLVVFAELAVLVLLLFFSKHKTKDALLKWSLIGYMVLVLLLEFNVFN